ncbi:UvrD-helicase domain-containing protein [Lysobacter gummosus]|uniref:UvrD-helicase domain-containing protein n=1 Tax=Lysobacter gummosus TaxID=262324 RepID=UPI00363532B1
MSLVHRIRDAARERLAELKRVRRVQSFDDLIGDVAAALEGPEGEVLAQRLREQYAVALVDEFQDTDPRQWAIFQRVFAQRALFLIGDPKQAIYGFRGGDVHTYLTAAALADQAPPLDHNFRSRPSLLRAISALYAQAGETAFVDTRIAFREVQAGGAVADADLQRDGATAPALTVRALPAPRTAARNPNGARRNRAIWPRAPASRRSTAGCAMRAKAARPSARARCSRPISPCWCAATTKPRASSRP